MNGKSTPEVTDLTTDNDVVELKVAPNTKLGVETKTSNNISEMLGQGVQKVPTVPPPRLSNDELLQNRIRLRRQKDMAKVAEVGRQRRQQYSELLENYSSAMNGADSSTTRKGVLDDYQDENFTTDEILAMTMNQPVVKRKETSGPPVLQGHYVTGGAQPPRGGHQQKEVRHPAHFHNMVATSSDSDSMALTPPQRISPLPLQQERRRRTSPAHEAQERRRNLAPQNNARRRRGKEQVPTEDEQLQMAIAMSLSLSESAGHRSATENFLRSGGLENVMTHAQEIGGAEDESDVDEVPFPTHQMRQMEIQEQMQIMAAQMGLSEDEFLLSFFSGGADPQVAEQLLQQAASAAQNQGGRQRRGRQRGRGGGHDHAVPPTDQNIDMSYESLCQLEDVPIPLPEEVLGCIPRRKFGEGEVASKTEQKASSTQNDSSNNQPTCPICLMTYEVGDEVATLPTCLHEYHWDCVKEWFKQRKTCCVCKEEVKIYW